jgi:6-phosphogluconate dehydrogenase
MQKAPFDINLEGVAHTWQQGSVVRSWLLELAERALKEDPNLDNLKGYVQDSGEGRWTVQAAIDLDVPAPVITQALFARFQSRQPDAFAMKLLAALRNQFGGHAVVREGTPS